MSIKLMSQVFEMETKSPSERLVLLVLANFADDEGSQLFPSKRTIARKAGVDERTASKVCSDLVASGVLEEIERHDNRPTRYRLVLEAHPGYGRHEKPRRDTTPASHHPGVTPPHPGVTPPHPGVTPPNPSYIPQLTAIPENPLKSPKGENPDIDGDKPFDDPSPETVLPFEPTTLPATVSPWWWEVPGPVTPEKAMARVLVGMTCKNAKPCFDCVNTTPEAVGRLVQYMKSIDPGDEDLDLEVKAFVEWHERRKAPSYKDGPGSLRKWLANKEAQWERLKRSRGRTQSLGGGVLTPKERLKSDFDMIDRILEERAV